MHTAGVCYCIFGLILVGCIVTFTVIYAMNPCCNNDTSEKYAIVPDQHLHATSGQTPVLNNRHHPMARAHPRKFNSIHDYMAGRNAAMWARHGWISPDMA